MIDMFAIFTVLAVVFIIGLWVKSRNKYGWKFSDFDNTFLCPGCGKEMDFCSGKYSGITVNIHSKQYVRIPGLYRLQYSCRNPCCEWSKIDGDEE